MESYTVEWRAVAHGSFGVEAESEEEAIAAVERGEPSMEIACVDELSEFEVISAAAFISPKKS